MATLMDGSIVTAQYRPFPKSTEFKVLLLLYTFANDTIESVWNQKILWEVGLNGLGDDMIDPESLHLMYFLTTPILKSNLENSKVAFLFLGRIFTLENEDGWKLKADKVEYLSGSELDVDLISFLPRKDGETIGQQLALVSDVPRID